MIEDPIRYPWSSCAALCAQREDPLIALHPTRHVLGADNRDRGAAYRALLADCITEHKLADIRTYLQ
jgi:putative transposase